MNYHRWIFFILMIAANGQVVQHSIQAPCKEFSKRIHDTGVLVTAQNPLEKNILNFMTKWRAGTKVVGVPIPLLKSVKIPPVKYHYEGSGLRLNYSIGETLVTGLDRFIIENMSASVKTLDITLALRFPVLTLVSENYKLNGWAYDFYPLNGSGKIKLVFRNSLLTANAHFGKIKDDATTVEDFVLFFDVKKIEAHLENSSWPINAILNSDGVEILGEYRSMIAKTLKTYVVPAVKDYLANIPPAQLLQITT